MKMENKGNYSVKNVKTMETDRGYTFTGSLLLNNSIIADFIDKGDGSCMSLNFISRFDSKPLSNFLKEYHKEISDNGETPDLFIASLCDEDEVFTKIKKMKNKKTLFSIYSEDTISGPSLRELEIPYCQNAISYLEKKYGIDLNFICNELFDVYPDNISGCLR